MVCSYPKATFPNTRLRPQRAEAWSQATKGLGWATAHHAVGGAVAPEVGAGDAKPGAAHRGGVEAREPGLGAKARRGRAWGVTPQDESGQEDLMACPFFVF